MKIKKIAAIFFILIFLNSFLNSSLYAYNLLPEYLCEVGMNFYRQGQVEEALGEFKKALMLEPDCAPAIKFVEMIEQAPNEESWQEGIGVPPGLESARVYSGRAPAVGQKVGRVSSLYVGKEGAVSEIGEVSVGQAVEPSQPAVIKLDSFLNSIPQPIQVEKGKSVYVEGKNISKVLVIDPAIISVEKETPDELIVTADNIGNTLLHIWDNQGRWTTAWQGIFPRPEGPTYEDLIRQEVEEARNFKLRYSLDFSVIETGNGVHGLKRVGSNTWVHNISLNGPTPYGEFDTAATVRRMATTELTYITAGLMHGKWGEFKDFDIRGGDLTPYFSNIEFPSNSVRGVMFYSPAFNKKIEYSAFWGRESGGMYQLSPDLYKTKSSFLSGANLSLSPMENQNYQFSVLRGWGRDRLKFLKEYGYDFIASWNVGGWGFKNDLAYDTNKFAQIFSASHSEPKIKFNTEFRNVNKDFVTMTGNGPYQGQIGGLVNLNYRPTEKLSMDSRLDVYLDRLFPAIDNDDRWNEDFDWRLNYKIDPLTDLSLSYFLQNDLGKMSQSRYQSPGIGFSRNFKFIRDIHGFFDYSYRRNQNYSSPSLSYNDDRILTGIRFNLFGNAYYYINKEINWLREKYTSNRSMPNATETGVDWSGQLFGNSPLYSSLRFTYRDEEDASSPLSFLAGQDYIEGYAELTYRRDENKDIYSSVRVRNNWADNENVAKRVDASLNAGMRCYWDTGVHWDAVCNIDGYVFRDLNSDGLMEKNDAPISGVKIWLGKKEITTTDLFGYFRFDGVRGQTAHVSIDTSSIPQGYLLTVPASQDVMIMHNQTSRLYFGIMSHSEISGVVFEDVNGSGKYDLGDKTVESVVLIFDGSKQVTTDNNGRYSFGSIATGEHTVALDLESIPVKYIPKTALTKKINLFEGLTYIYNIPLSRTQE